MATNYYTRYIFETNQGSNYEMGASSHPQQISLRSNQSNFLAPDQCLVYIENRHPFADVDGSTQIAQIVRSYIENDKLWFDLLLNTDADGDTVVGINSITVSGDNIVSNRAYYDIRPRQFYHFASLAFSSEIEYPIKARSFVIKKNLDKPLESTSRSALGSGIYGRYIPDPNDIPSLLVGTNQSVYLIDSSNAYIIQDKEHGDSITIASLNTNRYMDRIIQSLRDDSMLNLEEAKTRIRINESPNLLTLWNIVFYRTQDVITKDLLEDILARYAVKYLTDIGLVDSVNGEIIQELPIDDIMRELGYEGLLASDVYNNGWNRGCVSYNYSQAAIMQGDTARY